MRLKDKVAIEWSREVAPLERFDTFATEG